MRPHFTMDYLRWLCKVLPETIPSSFGVVYNLIILSPFGVMDGSPYPHPFHLHPLYVSKQIQPVFSH